MTQKEMKDLKAFARDLRERMHRDEFLTFIKLLLDLI
jgi:hypothetical protein